MSSFLDAQVNMLKNELEGKIDFVGQERTEDLTRQILWSAAAIAFIVGAVLQSLYTTMLIFGAGVAICCAVVLPSYPAYTQHPVKWLAPLDEYGQPLPPSPSSSALEPKKDR